MKIVIVTTFYDKVCGISSFVKNIVKININSGIDVKVISPDIKINSNYKKSIIKDARILSSIQIFKFLLKEDFRFIQCHCTWYMLFACIIYKKFMQIFGKEVRLITVKHSDFQNISYAKKNVLQFLDNCTDGVVFVSNYLEKSYSANLKIIHSVPVSVIYPGVSKVIIDTNLQNKLAMQINSKDRWPILSYIGLFEYDGKVRGLIRLLESVEILKSLWPDFLLIIAGRGHLKQNITNAVKKLKLERFVYMIDNLYSPYELLSLSTIYCHVSFQESFGLVILEALSTGTPVIASGSGEISFLHLPGLIVCESDALSIASCINNNLRCPPIVDVKEVYDQFDWGHSAAALNAFTRGYDA